MAYGAESSRLHATVPAHAELADVGRLLRAGGPGGWLGNRVAGGPPDMRRYATDLRLGRPGNRARAAIRKSAYVDLGSVKQLDQALRVEISWRSASVAPLFPVFSGWLTVRPDEISIDGRYVPPGGPLGFVADRALLHRAARYTAEWLLGALDQAASQRSASLRRSAYPGPIRQH
jgi:hypothetical protein